MLSSLNPTAPAALPEPAVCKPPLFTCAGDCDQALSHEVEKIMRDSVAQAMVQINELLVRFPGQDSVQNTMDFKDLVQSKHAASLKIGYTLPSKGT